MGRVDLSRYILNKFSIKWKNEKKRQKYYTGYHHTIKEDTNWKRGCTVNHSNPICWVNTTTTTNVTNPIRQIGWEELENRTLVIDISIYLYKFNQTTEGLEFHLRKLLKTFNQYKIYAYFIFDGKPPQEKIGVIRKRCWYRKQAKDIYEKVLQEYQYFLENGTESCQEAQHLLQQLNELRIKKTRVYQEDIAQAKNIITEYPLAYFYNAPEEADEVCALFVHYGLAYACMSDDMDLFLYGCPRILRCYQIETEHILFYQVPTILKELNLDLTDLQQICALTGESDYQHAYQAFNPNISLETAFEYHIEYRIQNCNNNNKNDFYTFLLKKSIHPEWILYIKTELERINWVKKAQLIIPKEIKKN
jgi:5'-3' exonuclease